MEFIYIYIYKFESFELSTNKYCKRSYRAERFFVSKETKYVVKLRSRDSFFSPSQTDVWVVGVRGAWGVSVIERGEKKNRFIVSSLTGTISSVAQVSGERVRLVISLPLGAAAVVVVRKDLVIVNVTAGQQRAPAWTTHRSGHVCVS